MPIEVRVLAAALLALAVTFTATPRAARFARRVHFYDEPHGYKAHTSPTPYLGGAAVMAGFMIAAAVLGDGLGRYLTIVLGAGLLWALGTLDDRRLVSPLTRVLIAAVIAVALWEDGFGWAVSSVAAVNLVLTVLWVVGMVNSFNLLDNMDGAMSSVALLSASGLATLALVDGSPLLAALAFALAGACLGFLRYNLTLPARIFLGDGGSMPVGFLIAALALAISRRDSVAGLAPLFCAILLTGVPILDTSLVIVSRSRRRISVLKGGRDHLTHRLRRRLTSARRVALALALGQLALDAVAVISLRLGADFVWAAAGIYLLILGSTLVILERPPWVCEIEVDQGEPLIRAGSRSAARSELDARQAPTPP